ncbi:MAG TPA: lysine--tRNA ligase [Terriglobales bacterium]|nr:lysine--tRNA ligase [Terriglobales bacterium]
MSLELKIHELRRQKLQQIEALGQQSYPYKYEFSHLVPQVLAEYGEKQGPELEANRAEVRVAGRIMAVRLMGKAGFMHLQQAGQRLQVYVKKDDVGEKQFELFKLLDIGDHIGVKGYLFRTRTNELTVHVQEITFLSKDLLPLPEKWHGLTDVELRYRQRYVDLFMNPEVREVFVKRAQIVRSIRRWFDERNYVEVETPMMQPLYGGAAARPFVTHHNTLDIDLYLRIAPELYLKRLTVGGLDRVYEINRNFRNEGISTSHNPEFTMLEFYQAYADMYDMMQITEDLLSSVARETTGSPKVKFGDHEIDWSNWQRLTMREAIIKYWPDEAGNKPEISDFDTVESVGQLVARLNASRTPHMVFDPKAPAGRTIADLFEAVAEEHLIQPTIIYEFPMAISPLAKNSRKPEDRENWVERFEVFVGGMEIGNAFSELNDPEEQRRRFEQQLAEKARGDEEAHQMDEDYVRALSYGMPPTGGEGIGVDRLAMLLTDSHSIRDVILFPLMRPAQPQELVTEEETAESEKK